MKNFFNFMMTIFLFLSSSIYSELYEIKNFKEIYNYIDEDTLVILDIDDTLLIPSQMLGCDEWFIQRMNQQKNAGLCFKEALEKTLFEWEGIRSITEMELVEDSIAGVIDELQHRNISMLCLTTQRFALGPRTTYQLKKHGIEIEKTSPYRENLFFMNQNLGVLFFEGILFTNGTHKGKTFFKFCELTNTEPKKIVFVNDKGTHLKEIEDSSNERNIPFIGLRYGFSDDHRKNFSYQIAEIQSKNITIDEIVSDSKAMQMK